MRKGEV